MSIYRKKPVLIEAFEYGVDKKPDWFNYALQTGTIKYAAEGQTLLIKTLEGVMTAPLYHFIVRGVEGEIYGVDGVIFRKTYELEQWYNDGVILENKIMPKPHHHKKHHSDKKTNPNTLFHHSHQEANGDTQDINITINVANQKEDGVVDCFKALFGACKKSG